MQLTNKWYLLTLATLTINPKVKIIRTTCVHNTIYSWQRGQLPVNSTPPSFSRAAQIECKQISVAYCTTVVWIWRIVEAGGGSCAVSLCDPRYVTLVIYASGAVSNYLHSLTTLLIWLLIMHNITIRIRSNDYRIEAIDRPYNLCTAYEETRIVWKFNLTSLKNRETNCVTKYILSLI